MAPVSFERVGRIGYLTLCREGTLNPLNLAMVQLLDEGLRQHLADVNVAAIVIRSAHPKAFCAGGDMKLIREWVLAERYAEVEQFFSAEYALNLCIARCDKPYIAVIDGIAMGGGLGLSTHGTYQLVSERALLAMPESRIGFFPDVGGSYFLPRMALNAGNWLAYTATPVSGIEAVQIGLASHHVASEKLAQLMASLEEPGGEPISNVLKAFAATVPAVDENPELVARGHWFANRNVQHIETQLIEAATSSADAAQLLSQLRTASPHSLELTQSLFQRTQDSNLESCLQLELKTAVDAAKHAEFIEGVRAVLVDKDRNPQW